MAKNMYLPGTASSPDWGTFIAPNKSLENCQDPHIVGNVPVISGVQANFTPFTQQNPLFDSVINKISTQRQSMIFEDQCSAKYYFDIFTVLQQSLAQVNRIAEVGVYAGGASCILAGCIENTDKELDLIDVNPDYLRYTFERIRRLYPTVAARTRMFLGDLPTYVKQVMLKESQSGYLVHHDASHLFNVVVRDLAALSYVKNKIYALLIQDTHLRSGDIHSYIFVDAALYAVFGDGLAYAEIGVKHTQDTMPSFQYSDHGLYFHSHQAEGMFIPFANLSFRYPHPSISLESFFAKEEVML